ncbi:MAG: type II secretion system F family protein [Alphaproteobacteria bacterium]
MPVTSPGLDAQLPLLLSFAAVLLLLGGIAFIVLKDRYGARARLARRVEQVAGRGGGSSGGSRDIKAITSAPRRKAIQDKLKEIEDKRKKQKTGRTLKGDLLQAGLQVPPRKFIMFSAAFGVLFALFAFVVLKVPPFVAVLALIIGSVGLPRLMIKRMIKRRLYLFTHHFATAIDIIVRGIRTGLPVGECLNVIGREMPDPVALEFRLIVEGQRLGMTLEDVMDRAIKRTPTAELKFFAIVLIIQKQTGGNLADTLEKLSDVLRERRKMREKAQAMSSEAKASAMIIGALPFMVAGLLYMVSPDYISTLFILKKGHMLLTGGGVWMLLGVFVMSKMINFDM